MNRCSEWQERAALFAGGDLPPAETSEVEAHLAGCPSCQASRLNCAPISIYSAPDIRGPSRPNRYVRLRARIMQRVDAGSRGVGLGGSPFWPSLLSRRCYLRSSGRSPRCAQSPQDAFRRPHPECLRLSTQVQRCAALSPLQSLAAASPPGRHHTLAGSFEKAAALYARAGTPLGEGRGSGRRRIARRRRWRRSFPPRWAHLRQRPQPPPSRLVVKLLTNDPNVVIYWITDTKGDY